MFILWNWYNSDNLKEIECYLKSRFKVEILFRNKFILGDGIRDMGRGESFRLGFKVIFKELEFKNYSFGSRVLI